MGLAKLGYLGGQPLCHCLNVTITLRATDRARLDGLLDGPRGLWAWMLGEEAANILTGLGSRQRTGCQLDEPWEQEACVAQSALGVSPMRLRGGPGQRGTRRCELERQRRVDTEDVLVGHETVEADGAIRDEGSDLRVSDAAQQLTC